MLVFFVPSSDYLGNPKEESGLFAIEQTEDLIASGIEIYEGGRDIDRKTDKEEHGRFKNWRSPDQNIYNRVLAGLSLVDNFDYLAVVTLKMRLPDKKKGFVPRAFIPSDGVTVAVYPDYSVVATFTERLSRHMVAGDIVRPTNFHKYTFPNDFQNAWRKYFESRLPA